VNDVEVLKNTSKQRLHGAAALRLGTRLYTAGQSRTRTAQLGSTGSSRTRKGEVLVVHLDSWVLAEVEDDDVGAVVADARAQAWLGWWRTRARRLGWAWSPALSRPCACVHGRLCVPVDPNLFVERDTAGGVDGRRGSRQGLASSVLAHEKEHHAWDHRVAVLPVGMVCLPDAAAWTAAGRRSWGRKGWGFR